MEKTLDRKLASIHEDPAGARDFIICDAKDADMAFGAVSGGRYNSAESPRRFPFRSREEFIDQIRAVVHQNAVDIMLMSNSIAERLVHEEKLFRDSPMTPAVRANDTSDIHGSRGGNYPRVASVPFRSATIDQLQCGRVRCADEERAGGVDLGLYSITWNNNTALDLPALEAYKTFRVEAESAGFRHFLEIFDPNISGAVEPEVLGHFINDQIIRTLAAVPRRSRPVFIKTVYHGARFMEELVHYDPHLIVGVMGGSAGTTFDAFNLLYQARRYGARAALFGRKINQAEHQPAFIRFLRMIADGEIGPAEAVRAYHGALEKLGLRPLRPLRDDLLPEVDLHAGDEQSCASVVVPERAEARAGGTGAGLRREASAATLPDANPAGGSSAPSALCEAEPDFDAMTPAQKLDYNQRRRDRIFG